ncbi:uncharacterized protein LOC120339315 [Styela clava]
MSGRQQEVNSQGSEERIDLMSPKSLTTEESDLLRRLRLESAWTRGYPLALISGGLTVIATRKVQSSRLRIALAIVGAVSGNIVGKISYLPVIQQRILTELPESSPLRQKVQAFKDGGPEAIARLSRSLSNEAPADELNHDVTFDTGSEYEKKNMEPDSGTKPVKIYTSYEELRKKHREERSLKPTKPEQQETLGFLNQSNVKGQNENFSANDDSETSPLGDSSAPSRPVRYNKYGDPILE